MSSSEWKKFKIGDLGKIVTGKTPPTINKENFDGNFPFITPVDMHEQKNIYFTNRTLSEIGKQLLKNFMLEPNTVCVSCIGSNLGKVVKTTRQSFTNQQINSIICKKDFNPDFVYYALISISEELRSIGHHSTAVPIINKTDFSYFEIYAPVSLAKQTRIASILSSLDDKIELNRQSNQTLEAIAQTLFKEMCLSKGEELPEGWRNIKLNEIIRIKHGYAFKGDFFSDEETEDILLTPGNFKIGGGFNYSKFKYYKGDFPNDYILKENDLVVTMTDLSKEGDTLGYSALVPTILGKRLLHNQRIGKVEFKNEGYLKSFLYFMMREANYRNFVLGSATGTTVRHTSPDRICDFNIKLPNDNLLSLFSHTVQPILENILNHEQESQTLAAIRDSLLPKLMKGEIEQNLLSL